MARLPRYLPDYKPSGEDLNNILAIIDSGLGHNDPIVGSGITGDSLNPSITNPGGSLDSSKSGTSGLVSMVRGLTGSYGIDNFAQTHTAYVLLSWTPNPVNDFVSRYDIYYHKGSDPTLYTQTVGSNITSTRINNLFPGNTYSFSVRATDAADRSSQWCPELAITISNDATAPAVPTGLSVTGIGNELHITWTEVGSEGISNDLKQYLIAISTDGGVNYATTKTIGPGNSYLFKPSTLIVTPYFVKIASVDWTGNTSAFSAPASASLGPEIIPGSSAAGMLQLTSGNTNGSNTLSQIAFGYFGDAPAVHYQQFITTEHQGGGPDGNKIKFWTDDGTQAAVFPGNSKLGLHIENGRISVGAVGASQVGAFLQSPITAVGGFGHNLYIQSTLNAAANNDSLRAATITNMIYAVGAFTGVELTGISISGNQFTKTGAATPAAAYSLKISGPTIATTNRAIWVESGNALFGEAGTAIISVGTDNLFGAGANGGSGTYVDVGSLGDPTSAWIDARGSSADVYLNLRSKGASKVTLNAQDGVLITNKTTDIGSVALQLGTVNPSGTGTLPNYGAILRFSGGPAVAPWDSDNSDVMWMGRYNSASNESQLRVSISDDTQVQDQVVFGISNGYPGSSWTTKHTFDATGNATHVNSITSLAQGIVSTGANAGLIFVDRSGGQNWQWYGNASAAHLFNGAADTITIDTAGNLYVPGAVVITAASSKIIPGATQLSLRNNADNADNLLITNAGAVTGRDTITSTNNGLFALGANAAVYFMNRSGSNNWGWYATSDVARLWTGSADTIKVNTSGDLTLPALAIFTTAVSKVIPGATSLSLRNNADNKDNILASDAGIVTLRNALKIPPAADGTVPSTSYGTVVNKIEEQTPSSAGSVTLGNNFPTGWRNLKVRWKLRSSTAAGSVNITITFNGDTAANYGWQNLQSNNTTTTSAASDSASSLLLGSVSANSAPANNFGIGEMTIYDYNNSSDHKNIIAHSFWRAGTGTSNVEYFAMGGIWKSTAAITKVDILFGSSASGVVEVYGEP